jgi:hypothetical protein
MGSKSIAEELEKNFNSPSLQFDSEESARVEELAEKLLISSRPLWAHLLPKKLLVPSDRQYYADTRAKRFGMSLDLYYSEHVSQQLWYQLDAICHEIAEALAETPGPFLMNYHRKNKISLGILGDVVANMQSLVRRFYCRCSSSILQLC